RRTNSRSGRITARPVNNRTHKDTWIGSRTAFLSRKRSREIHEPFFAIAATTRARVTSARARVVFSAIHRASRSRRRRIRMTMPSRLLLVTLAAGIASAAGSSSPGTGSGQGGSGGTGATGGSSAGGSCQNVSACGGDTVGTWTVKSSCLTVNGNLNLGDFGAGCAFEPVTGALEVTGTVTINSDRTYADDTTTT